MGTGRYKEHSESNIILKYLFLEIFWSSNETHMLRSLSAGQGIQTREITSEYWTVHILP